MTVLLLYLIYVNIRHSEKLYVKCHYNHSIFCKKRAIRIVHNVRNTEHRNSLFLQSKLLKFFDLVEFKTAKTTHQARNNLLPVDIQTYDCVGAAI